MTIEKFETGSSDNRVQTKLVLPRLSSGYSTLSVNDRRTPEEVGGIPLTIVPALQPRRVFIAYYPYSPPALIGYLLVIHFNSSALYQMSQ